ARRAAGVVAVAVVVAVVVVDGAACTDLVPPPPNAPVALNGVLDASTWDFAKDGPIVLDGTWDFFWHARPSSDPDLATRPATPRLPVPGQWDDAGFDAIGFGTFRLKLKLPPQPSSSSSSLALAKSHADSAYALSANGASVIKSGIVGSNADDELREGRYA